MVQGEPYVSQESVQHFQADTQDPVLSPLTPTSPYARPSSRSLDRGLGVHAPRARTPCDQEYAHIGAYKLGSLRITNGSASPSPSRKKKEAEVQDEQEIRLPGDFQEPAEELPYQAARRVLERRSSGFQALSESIARLGRRSGGNLRRDKESYKEEPLPMATGRSAVLTLRNPEPDSSVHRPGAIVETLIDVPKASALALFDFEGQLPTHAAELAQQYMQDIVGSPFSFEDSQPGTPRFCVTSKNTAQEDDLFEDDQNVSSDSLVRRGSPEHALQILSGGLAPQAQLLSSSVESSLSGVSQGKSSQAPSSGAQSIAVLSKIDSGYSSTQSLKSLDFHNDGRCSVRASLDSVAAPPVPDKTAPPTPPKANFEEDLPKSILRPSPPVPLKHSSVYSFARSVPVPALPLKSPEQSWAAAQARPHVILIPSQPCASTRSSLPPSPAKSDLYVPSPSPAGSDTSTSSSRGRFNRQRSQIVDITVQGQQEIEQAQIPPVSPEAASRLDERLKQFPMLTHTYKTPQHTKSTETLATITSVETVKPSEELSAVSPQKPTIELSASANQVVARRMGTRTLSQSDETTKEALNRRSTLEDMRRQHEFESQLASFGSVTRSIGASPYDVAVSAMALRARSGSISSLSSSHNGDVVARGRTVGMDESAASEFARERSRLRENERRRSISRRQSCDSNFDDRGGIPGKSLRSSSVVHDAPPLPMLPSREEIKRYSMPSKTKSPPPVSMATQRKGAQTTTPPPSRTPSRTPPTARVQAPMVERSPTHTPPAENLPAQKADAKVSPGEQTRASTELPEPQPMGPFELSVDDPWEAQQRMWQAHRQSTGTVSQPDAKPTVPTVYPEFQHLARPAAPVGAVPRAQTLHKSRPKSISYEKGKLPAPLMKSAARPYSVQPVRSGQLSPNPTGRASLPSMMRSTTLSGPSQSMPHLPLPSPSRLSRSPRTSPSSSRTSLHTPHPLSQSTTPALEARRKSMDIDVPDRYNGGLAYGYEPGYGLGGSAGMRSSRSIASRKSIDISQRYGVDFSDVPVLLQSSIY